MACARKGWSVRASERGSEDEVAVIQDHDGLDALHHHRRGAVAFSSNYYLRVFTLIYIFGLAAIGLILLMGFAGQVSLGHAGFVGLGAYSVALAPTHLGISAIYGLGIGAFLSAAIALVLGRPILKLKGHYLAELRRLASDFWWLSSSRTRQAGPAVPTV